MWWLVILILTAIFACRDYLLKRVDLPQFLTATSVNDLLRQENLQLQKKILLLEEERNLYFLVQKSLYGVCNETSSQQRAKELLEEANICLLSIEKCYNKKSCNFEEIQQELSGESFAVRKTLLWCESLSLASNLESRSLLLQELSLLIKWFSLYLNHLIGFSNTIRDTTSALITLQRIEKRL